MPNSISLSRTKDYVVNVEKEGCQPGRAQVSRSFNGTSTILGNILWLLPGVVVDLWAGGAWTLEPDHVSVSLACSQQSQTLMKHSGQPSMAYNIKRKRN